MPELSDDMYCSQQITVPPMFPYILRQYAKAAIRSQPTDLLRWSTAYFRCLSLNLPPPVKPRLEYPLPKDYDGVTPGWLRALLYQFANSTHVDFKVLWDRWMGACQNHLTLIKILCLGGFTDPMAIPLLRFVGLCVGFLSENLTQTMIVFCEVVTEEPEGGSAMIPVETFIDVYTFLASIDASKDQVLLNRYFPDEMLALLEKKVRKAEKVEDGDLDKKERIEKEASSATETVEEESKAEEVQKDAISCPDLRDDQPGGGSSEDSDNLDQGSRSTIVDDKDRVAEAIGGKPTAQVDGDGKRKRVQKVRLDELGEGEGEEDFTSFTDEEEIMGEGSPIVSAASGLMRTLSKTTDDDADKAITEEQSTGEPAAEPATEPATEPVVEKSQPEVVTDDPAQDFVQDEDVSTTKVSSLDSLPVGTDTEKEGKESHEAAGVDSVNLTTSQMTEKKSIVDEAEVEVEVVEEVNLDKYLKGQSDVGESVTETFTLATEVVKRRAPVEELGEYSVGEPEVAEEQELEIEGKFVIEEIFVEAIPGIGPVVPAELVEAVVEYMKRCAVDQQGMVMPRNVRHYSCPPLEVYQ